MVLLLACGSSSSKRPIDADTDIPVEPVVVAPEIRWVADGRTFVSRDGRPMSVVIESSYDGSPSLARATRENPWDVFDPISKRYIAVFRNGDNRHGLYAVGPTPTEVLIDSAPEELASEPAAWGVMSADGMLLYLSTGANAYVAKRKGQSLTFGKPRNVGFEIGVVHDVSPDGTLVLASGHLPIKWGNSADIAAPRRVGIFRVDEAGQAKQDLSATHRPLEAYVQMPTFQDDGAGVVFEGDDDIDTGDRLFVYRFGSNLEEVHPSADTDKDFNTPCATFDGRIAFWESVPGKYLLRVYDPRSDQTQTVHDEWLPFTGYVRCR